MKYFEEAKYLWKTYVPKHGQSETVQGELIRAIEKLRDEAQRNGNGNWDRCFEMFCDFLETTLCGSEAFDEGTNQQIQQMIGRLRDYEKPCLDDEIYDRITDYIVEWHFQNREPILKPYDPNQYR